ncbi:MAG: MmcQ/YjbR family DNA-binding protein [Alphaproteobacteria bacterium]|nr:MmcQ/YjbR family DNA-binding protein [Alphaproteobacteria bacterium]
MALTAATESVQWGSQYVYKVGGKMFAIIGMDGRAFDGVSFKVASDSFHILTKEPGVIPAPYLARAGWIMIERLDILPDDHLRAYIARSHALVVAKLPKKLRPQVPDEERKPRGSAKAKARTAP